MAASDAVKAVHHWYNSETYPDADFVLVTEDNVSFHIHAIVLRFASPIFAALVRPQGKPNPLNRSASLSESSDILEVLLDLMYPGRSLRDIPTIEKFRSIALAAQKYEMREELESLRNSFADLRRRHKEEYDPLSAYAVACQFGWEELQRAAAKDSLQLDMTEVISSGQLLSRPCLDMGSLVYILQWHIQRRDAVIAALVGTGVNDQGIWGGIHRSSQMKCRLAQGRSYLFDRHGPELDVAISRTKLCVLVAIDKRPDFSEVLDTSFWDGPQWEFAGINCAYCKGSLFEKADFCATLAKIFDSLPPHPVGRNALRDKGGRAALE